MLSQSRDVSLSVYLSICLSSFHVIFFEASHWPSGHMINSRHLIGQPSFTTKLRGGGVINIYFFLLKSPLVAVAATVMGRGRGGGGRGWGTGDFCIKAPWRRHEGITKMLKSFLAAVLLSALVQRCFVSRMQDFFVCDYFEPFWDTLGPKVKKFRK